MAAVLVSVVAVCAILYWAQSMLIPLALASLLTFMLAPVVKRIEHWGLGRIPAVVLVTTVFALLIGSAGWTVGKQVSSLAQDLPTYRENIKKKLSDMRGLFRGGALDELQTTFTEITEELEEQERPADGTSQTESVEGAVPVRIETGGLALFNTTVSPVLQVVGVAGLVFVLMIFMLVHREDLLNRLVSLAGIRGVASTTKAIDEGANRIGRYLLVQFILNAGYGLVLGVALWFVGVPYSIFWGLCAAVFRYVPYIGPWFAAVLPIAVSATHFPGWTTVLLVIGIFVVLELLSNNLLEPWLYGGSVGLSAVAIIVSAIFWTLLWGPVGLVLATPMTVCLVVLGKHIPQLSVFDRLLSERPALEPHVWLYQRLLGRNDDDAAELLREHVEQNSLESAYDEVLMPTLVLAKREWLADRIEEADLDAILNTLQEVIDALPADESKDDATPAAQDASVSIDSLVIGFPIGEADELLLEMVERLLGKRGGHFESISSEMLIAERIALVQERKPACVCVSSLAPGDLMQTQQICKRLKSKLPDLKIIVGRWESRGVAEKTAEMLRSVGVDRTVSTLSKMREALGPLIQFHAQDRENRVDREQTEEALIATA